MTNFIALIWQYNLELSFILVAVLIARFAIRKTTKNYNAYLLWLAIPVGYSFALLLKNLNFSAAKSELISNAVQTFSVLPDNSTTNYSFLGWTWSLVAFALIIRLVWQHKQLRKQLKQQIVAGNIEYPESSYPVITIDNKSLSPAVYGFVFPKIYFPIHVAKELNPQQLRLIIEHEQHHIKQKHLWLNLLWDLGVCLAWFNPLIYISRQQFRHDQELFCDYLVLNQSASHDQKAYGHALLSTVSATASVSLLCSWKMFNQLEERIMNISKPMGFTGKLALVIGSTFIIGCSALYAANKQAPDGTINERTYIKDDGTTASQIKWNANGITYGNDNGYLYIIDKSGNKREMTEEEKREFEKVYEETQEELKLAQEEMEQARLEMIEAHKEMEMAQREIEQAHLEMEKATREAGLSDEERKAMEREFEVARQEMKKAQIEIREAQKEMRKAQREMEKEVRQLHRKAPKPPKPSTRVEQRTPPTPPALRVVRELERTPPQPPAAAAKILERIPPAPSVAPETIKPVKTVPPKYPVSAIKNGIEGFVKFEFDVLANGEIDKISVLESFPKGVFEVAAQEAISKWKFSSGNPTQNLTYTLDFALNH